MEKIILDLLLICVAALIGGFCAKLLHLPLLIGYVVAGIAIGPYTAGPTVTAIARIELLAEIGLAFLLFTLGVELSFKGLRPVRRIAVLGTLLQMFLCILYGMGMGLFFGWSWPAAIWLGILLSLSSVLPTLNTLRQLHLGETTVGRIVSGFVTMQNLWVVPFILLLYEVSQVSERRIGLGLALLEGVMLLTILFCVGLWVVPKLVSLLRAQSSELQLLVVLGSIILAGVATHWYGLPFVFVAFALALSLSEAESLQPPLKHLLSWRDFFGVFFFVAAGMLLNLPAITANVHFLLLLVTFALVGKGLLFVLIVRWFGYPQPHAWVVALLLSPVSELSLMLGYLGRQGKVFDEVQYALITGSILLTLLFAAILPRMAQERVPTFLTRAGD